MKIGRPKISAIHDEFIRVRMNFDRNTSAIGIGEEIRKSRSLDMYRVDMEAMTFEKTSIEKNVRHKRFSS